MFSMAIGWYRVSSKGRADRATQPALVGALHAANRMADETDGSNMSEVNRWAW